MVSEVLPVSQIRQFSSMQCWNKHHALFTDTQLSHPFNRFIFSRALSGCHSFKLELMYSCCLCDAATVWEHAWGTLPVWSEIFCHQAWACINSIQCSSEVTPSSCYPSFIKTTLLSRLSRLHHKYAHTAQLNVLCRVIVESNELFFKLWCDTL